MRTILIVTILVSMTKMTNSCCCTSGDAKTVSFQGGLGVLGIWAGATYDVCYCNWFNCNCDTDSQGYCQYKVKRDCAPGTDRGGLCKSSSSKCVRYPSHLPSHFAEKACDRRKKRQSFSGPGYEKYSKMYPELVGNSALDVFAFYDLNGDGTICLTEFNSTIKSKSSHETDPLHAFKQVDLNQDGRIQPNEFDQDLNP
eukprot:GFUD01013651.1.p1 GENE.GFUD01013651.1~~GFUD01013651.1.p1  ORF type:complete len:198 (-),score=24.96 GFUD01013651.1:215-808(-)